MWRIAAAVLAAAFMLLITELAYQSQSEQLGTLAKMGKARLTLAYAMQRVTDAEAGKRGYLLVGGQDYLEPYVRASNDVRVALREIHALDHASGEASLPSRQLKLDQLFDEKLAEMQEVLRRHDSGKPPSTWCAAASAAKSCSACATSSTSTWRTAIAW